LKNVAAKPAPAAGKKPSMVSESFAGDKAFTGEKIALDFYDTDIKNVFRILQEISGKNFAIDKNVSGKVTLALQRPVPWDQVLDLVLKMNQLGMVREGDIIRIASLATLQQEEKMRQAQLKAEQEAKKQEEEGESLVTEYIPVNYSNAKSEVLPHLTNILTPNRGKATVDERNNQVIFTDIAEKVKQARAIVERIDRVTSQVIIEARVVEANSSFNREIGFDWGTITIEAFKIGGALKVGPTALAANNIPQSFRPDNAIGFNFSTLFGTNISIVDAKLSASELEGKATIISAPKIITLNSKKATIKQGLEVPYLERDSSGNATVRFKDVDLLLEVTPNISQDRRIVMNIFITKNDVVDPTAPEPALSTNEAKTEILVEDGDTIVIGGILKDTRKLTDQGIPGLRKLPAFGWLFRSERVETSKNELLIFITPRIIQLEQRKTI
jgi:type IV pilus assembly protein PilQ